MSRGQGHGISLDVATSNYNYDDSCVTIYVGQEVFKIGRSRLAQRSPVFRELFDLPQPLASPLMPRPWQSEPASPAAVPVFNFDLTGKAKRNPGEVPLPPSPRINSGLHLEDSTPTVLHLHNDPDDFRHYLWAIHADFIDAEDFRNEPASAAKCTKLLGIASVAHMYEVTAMANRTLEEALGMLQSYTFHIDEPLAFRVIHTSRRWVDQPEIASRARLIIREAMRSQRIDVFGVILLAEPLNDRELLGWGYYYLLQRGKDHWVSDARVRAIDRRRLLAGAFALSEKWVDLCKRYTERGNSDHYPPWAIFDKLGTIYGGYYGPVPKADIEATLYAFFDPEAWDL